MEDAILSPSITSMLAKRLSVNIAYFGPVTAVVSYIINPLFHLLSDQRCLIMHTPSSSSAAAAGNLFTAPATLTIPMLRLLSSKAQGRKGF